MEIHHLTEDEMAEVKKNALESLRPYLVEKLIAERHFDYLRSKKILTREDTEEIGCRSTRGKRAGKLLDLIAENPLGLDTLIESIIHLRTLDFIIHKITDEVQRCKNEKIEALRAAGVSSSVIKDLCGVSNDLSKSDLYDKCSTVCLHPDGEGSPASSVMSSSMNLSLTVNCPRGQDCVLVSGATSLRQTSSSLPKPGEPGAPPLPDEVTVEDQDTEAGACGSTGSSGDANFLPLRSRSINSSVNSVL